MGRIINHPILDELEKGKEVKITVDGRELIVYEGEMLAAALIANNIKVFRYTRHQQEPRGIYCGIGRCTDCVMTVDGIPNVRTCITPIKAGMVVKTQRGVGIWGGNKEND